MSKCVKRPSLPEECKSFSSVFCLPDSILLEVFHYLTFRELCLASSVCQVWHRVAKDSSLHRKIDVRDHPISVRKAWKLLRSHCNGNLRSLHLKGFFMLLKAMKPKWKTPTVTRVFLAELHNRCPNLQNLTAEEVFMANDTSQMTVSLSDFPCTLTHLSLRNSFFHPDSLFSSSPVSSLPKLKCLDLGHCSVVSSHDLNVLARWTSLSALYLQGCFRVNTGGIDHLRPILSTLVTLDVEGTDISDEGVEIIFNHCKVLKELFLGHTQITNKCFTADCRKSLSVLHTLCVRGTAVTEEGILCIAPSLSKLQQLLIRGTRIKLSGSQQLLKVMHCLIETNFDENDLQNSPTNVSCNHYRWHKCE